MPELQPIDACLVTLARALAGSRPFVRRVLEEARDHLEESAALFEATGLPRGEAEARAVAEFGDPRAVAAQFAPRPLEGVARALLQLGAAGCFGVAAWLGYVLLFVLPGRNGAQLPLWAAVMAGFAAYGAAAMAHLARPQWAPLRLALAVVAPNAFALGVWAVSSQLARADFEGYIVLMGAGLCAHSAAVMLHLVATRRSRGRFSARATG